MIDPKKLILPPREISICINKLLKTSTTHFGYIYIQSNLASVGIPELSSWPGSRLGKLARKQLILASKKTG